MKQINVFYCIDSNFFQLTLKSIDSVLQTFKNTKYKIRFYLITRDDITTTQSNISIIKVNEYEHLSIPQLRVLGPDLIDVDELIYLDSDTVLLSCISKLMSMDIDNNIIGACQHYNLHTGPMASKFYNLLPDMLSRVPVYLNSGVMKINCEMWRDNDTTIKCIDTYNHYRDHPQRYNDEPGINIALNNKWYQLPETWNYFPREKYTRCNLIHYYGQSIQQKPRNLYF